MSATGLNEAGSSAAGMNEAGDLVALTTALIRAMAASDLAEAELRQGAYHLRLSRAPAAGTPAAEATAGGTTAAGTPGAPAAATATPASATAASAPAEAPATVPAATPSAVPVFAPFHGVFYAAAEPGAAPLAVPGMHLAEGAPLGVIEAMKTFTPIPAPFAGRVEAVLCDSGAEVTPETVLLRLVPQP